MMTTLHRDGLLEQEIVIYHIGGEGDYGPVMTVISEFSAKVRLVVFDARDDAEDLQKSQTINRDGVRTTVISKGIDETAGRSNFNVNKWPLSSSLLALSPLTENENPAYEHCHTWGQNAELDHVITVDTVSIDDLVESGELPPPDIISIDAQGAELRILRGAKKALSTALCVVTEVEFFEIYDGQALFDDQMAFLSQHGFRLFNILNEQFWHPGPAVGKGFLTVGEAVFFRYVADLPRMEGKRGYTPIAEMTDGQLLRLAAIALAFKALGYAYTLSKFLKSRNPVLFSGLDAEDNYSKLPLLVDRVVADEAAYVANSRHFIEHGLPPLVNGTLSEIPDMPGREHLKIALEKLCAKIGRKAKGCFGG